MKKEIGIENSNRFSLMISAPTTPTVPNTIHLTTSNSTPTGRKRTSADSYLSIPNQQPQIERKRTSADSVQSKQKFFDSSNQPLNRNEEFENGISRMNEGEEDFSNRTKTQIINNTLILPIET